MNKIAQAQPDAIYFGGIIENNAAQLIKDKVGAGMSNDEVAFIGPDGIFVDALLARRATPPRASTSPSAGCPRVSSPGRARSSSRTSRRSTMSPSSPTPPTLTRRPTSCSTPSRRPRGSRRRGSGPRGGDRAGLRHRGLRRRSRHSKWSFDEDGDTTLTKLSVQRVENGEFQLDRVVDVSQLQ